LEIRQGPGRLLYAFAADGKQLPLFTAVSRVKRGDAADLSGYQRPEVMAHIASIRHYLESGNPMIPNALVVAFDNRVRFEPAPDGDAPTPYSRLGTLVVPVDEGHTDAEKPGWLVDGQQRSAAIREAQIDAFPVCITAFITGSEAEQRAQFILVNSTKPLPKGLIYELLPTTEGCLPVALQRKRFPAFLLERLNYDEDSPLQYMIRTPTTAEGIIKDNSVLRMLENSLYDGALYRFREPRTGEGEVESMLALLKNYWEAVRRTFPEAWGLPSRRSRLMHGVGIVSLGFVMDAVADHYGEELWPSVEQFAKDLEKLAPECAWTGGFWSFGADHLRRWNDLQNTPRDIQLLADHLLSLHRKRVLRGRR
jgi:DGQHR domain-containing protein